MNILSEMLTYKIVNDAMPRKLSHYAFENWMHKNRNELRSEWENVLRSTIKMAARTK